jgi:HEAT repeat protein
MRCITCLPLTVVIALSISATVVAQDNDVPRLIEKLAKDEKAGQRRAAARSLGEMGAKAKLAIPALVKALNDVDGSVRDEAENSLKKMGEPAVSELLPHLKDPDEFVRLRIVTVLGGIGPDAKAALPAIEAAKQDSSAFVRSAAEEAEIRIKVDAKALLGLLKDKDEDKRMYAVKAIAFLGPHAKPVLSDLCNVLRNDKSKEIRREVPRTLGRLGKDGKDAVPALAAALSDPDDTVKLNAMQALGEMGTDARPALQAIDRAGKAAQRSKNDELYQAAMRTWNLAQGKKPDAK